ncbi:MAG: hypothetical protein AAGC70_15075 [Pseudomonadota bacterium]
MDALGLLFSYQGRIGRLPFLAGLLVAFALLAGGVYGSFLLLEPAATYFQPVGINAGLLQTAFFVFIGVLFLWMLFALFAKRLRDRAHLPIWAPIAILPVVAVLVATGLLTVRPLVVVPPLVQDLVFFICGGIGIWILIEALFFPPRSPV